MGEDRERERERKGKRGGAIGVEDELTEETVPCGLCGDPLPEGENGGRKPRGSYHVDCMRKARQTLLGQAGRDAFENGGGRRRKRRG